MVTFSASALLVALVVAAGGQEGTPGESSPRVIEARVLDEGPGIPDPVMPGRRISYEIRIVNTEGFGWRDRLQHRGKRVGASGGSMAWVVETDLLKEVLDSWMDSTRTNIVQAPKLAMLEGVRGQVGNTSERFFVVALDRIADGPPGEASRVANQPIIERVREGIVIEVSSRKGAEGHVIDAELVETRVDRVHTHEFMDGVKGDPEKGTKPASLMSTYQIPEVVQARVSGSWDVPEGMNLVVTLPPRTVFEKGRLGMTREVTEERVVVITPRIIGQELAKVGR